MARILVVEDEKDIREDIEEILRLYGYKTFSAENGEEGIKIILKKFPDLVISDIMMPVMDGYELLKEVQDRPSIATTPFIFLTAKSDRSELRKGMNLGADDYLTKPFSSDDLIDAVKARLSKKSQNVEELERIKDNIIKYVPHEFRTPLASILGLSQLMEDENAEYSQEEIVEMAKIIRKSSVRLHNRIEKFLTLVDLGIISKKTADYDPMPHVENLISSIIKVHLESKQRVNDLELNLESTRLNIPDDYLKIVINELIENAVKFSESNSPVKVSGIEKGKFYNIVITDNGIGMTQEEIHNLGVFQQFNRDYRQQEGNGLGLIIVQKIIDFFDGKFKIESEKDTYNSVTISLPVYKNN